MKALAELLLDQGWVVTGSDIRPASEIATACGRGKLRIHTGHGHLQAVAAADLIVYSPAIPESNPELVRARAEGIATLSYTEMLGTLMESRTGVCIAGTHGKSTTTAMVAHILESSDMSPTVLIGAEMLGRSRNGWSGSSDVFVAESCEYQQGFLNLHPDHAVILGIEQDHFDCYSSLDDLTSAFARFAERIPAGGRLMIRADCPVAQAAARSATARTETFGLESGADLWATDLRDLKPGTRFRVFERERFITEITLPSAGRHNVINALAAVALCRSLDVPVSRIRSAVAEFPGVRRRFENVGSWRGVTLIDDYAHHPTAVRATLATARSLFDARRIWAVFEPHQVSRTEALLDEFATSFDDADEVLLAPVFAAREKVSRQVCRSVQRRLADRIQQTGKPVRALSSLDHITATLEDATRPGDVLITMGAGTVDRVCHEFTRRLQRNYSTQ